MILALFYCLVADLIFHILLGISTSQSQCSMKTCFSIDFIYHQAKSISDIFPTCLVSPRWFGFVNSHSTYNIWHNMTFQCSLTRTSLTVKWREIRNDFLIVSLKLNVRNTYAHALLGIFANGNVPISIIIRKFDKMNVITQKKQCSFVQPKKNSNKKWTFWSIDKQTYRYFNNLANMEMEKKTFKTEIEATNHCIEFVWIQIQNKMESIARFKYRAMCSMESICNWTNAYNVTTLGAAVISIETSFRQCVIPFLRHIWFFSSVVVILLNIFGAYSFGLITFSVILLFTSDVFILLYVYHRRLG